MKKIIRMQINELLGRKITIITYYILNGFVLVNFLMNLFLFREIKDVTQMYDCFKVLTLSTWAPASYYLMQFFPLLIVMATAQSYLNERNTRVCTYIQVRTGKRKYLYGKLLAVFIVTLALFTIPFLVELVISCVCFDLSSIGDPSRFGYHQTIEFDHLYLGGKLYLNNRLVYTILSILLFGTISGILAMWNVAISSLPIIKYKFLAFFPTYILLFSVLILENYSKPSFTLNYFLILPMFVIDDINYFYVALFFIILIVSSVMITELKIRKEEIL